MEALAAHEYIENLKFKEKKKRILIIAIVLIIGAFILGVIIGHFAISKPASKDDKPTPGPSKPADKKAEFKRQKEEMDKYHENFGATFKEEQLENSLK